jgi:ubiquinone/menaquinone biosynthesis C-methylase UbiE
LSFKDQFSEQACVYAAFRPDYSESIFIFLNDLVTENFLALDCGTGNGQTAESLSNYFKNVLACDPSRKLLGQARKKSNIFYFQSTAEWIALRGKTINLITVSQAIHWVNFNQFYDEVKQLLKPKGIIAFWGYNLPRINAKIDNILDYLYSDILGDYWQNERKYIDEEYKTIPFPFDEIKTPVFKMKTQWELKRFLGYIGSWSAVQNYLNKNELNPLELIKEKLIIAWGSEEKYEIDWPIFIRVGRVK